MAVRPIDAKVLHAEISMWPGPIMYKDWVQSAIATAPTLTPPNEWVSVGDAVPDPGVRVLEANGFPCRFCKFEHSGGCEQKAKHPDDEKPCVGRWFEWRSQKED